jgi:hypothetical protein
MFKVSNYLKKSSLGNKQSPREKGARYGVQGAKYNQRSSGSKV